MPTLPRFLVFDDAATDGNGALAPCCDRPTDRPQLFWDWPVPKQIAFRPPIDFELPDFIRSPPVPPAPLPLLSSRASASLCPNLPSS